jgi:hypothetical protein
MSNIADSLHELMQIDGAIMASIVDASSGMVLAKSGTELNHEVAAAGNTEVVRAKTKTMRALGLTGRIDDILITLDQQYHIITLVKGKDGLFLYTVLDRAKANLALARYKANDIQAGLIF